MTSRLAGADSGFTLIELVVAMSLALLVLVGAVALANPAGHVANAQPDAMDMEQKLRAGAAAIGRDLRMAGAGVDGGLAVGALNTFLPPILPRRIGATGAEPPESARRDVISVIWVPASNAQTWLAAPSSGGTLTVEPHGGCPVGLPACGVATGMGVLLFDSRGQVDLFTATGSHDQDVQVRHRGSLPAQAYDVGAVVSEVEARTYYFDRASRQLRLYDTDLSDSPVLDGLTEFQVEYFGSPSPPTSPKPPLGQSNCLYDDAGNSVGAGPTLAGAGDGLAPLPLSLFTDGPWCGTGDFRFDVDLLRVRRLRVTFGLQASSPSHRTSRSAWRRLPDRMVTFDISPRNLRLAGLP